MTYLRSSRAISAPTLAALALVVLMAASCGWDSTTEPGLEKTLGIVLMIGDGMGYGAVQAASRRSGTLTMEAFPVHGSVDTKSGSDEITDSGASATAYATGVSTYNRAIGVGLDSVPVKNVSEIARELGMAVGIVATSSVTHATPAAFLAHVEDRSEQEEIASQIVTFGADIVLGGGYQFFDPAYRADGRDLISQLLTAGYSIATDAIDLDLIPDSDSVRIFGLFADGGMSTYETRTPSLSEMATVALRELLQYDAGFFLMVEGSQIDWAAHSNDPERLVGEVLDFDNAVETVLELVKHRPNTLVIITADHETGGLTVGSDSTTGEYVFHWATTGHTADSVPLFAFGDESYLFAGEHTNAEVGILLQQFVLESAGSVSMVQRR